MLAYSYGIWLWQTDRTGLLEQGGRAHLRSILLRRRGTYLAPIVAGCSDRLGPLHLADQPQLELLLALAFPYQSGVFQFPLVKVNI